MEKENMRKMKVAQRKAEQRIQEQLLKAQNKVFNLSLLQS